MIDLGAAASRRQLPTAMRPVAAASISSVQALDMVIVKLRRTGALMDVMGLKQSQ
jgi:hypothetical protein